MRNAIARALRSSAKALMLIAACLGFAPTVHAGLTIEIHVVRFNEGQLYKFFTPLYTNSIGPAATQGTYFISSPFYSALQTTNGSWRELQVTTNIANGVNTLNGTENSYPDFNSVMAQITNGAWTIVFTNDTTTNTYTFTVSAPDVTSNMLPAMVFTYPYENELNIPNQPTFTWQGPTNWPVYNNTYVFNWDYSFFQYASLAATQETWSVPFTIPNGMNCSLELQYLTNNSPLLFTTTTPMTTNSESLDGWETTNVLETGDTFSFAVTNPPVSSLTLVAHYAFDDTNDIGLDSSGNGYNLDFNGGDAIASTNDAEAGNGAAYFDGNGFLTYSTPPASILNTLAGDFSLSFWIKTTQNTGDENGPGYFGSGIVAADIPGLYNDVIPAALDGGEIGINTGGPGGDDTLDSAADINDGNYHHVVVTRSEETGEKDIYIDGVLNNSDFATMNPLSDIRSVAVGCAIDASQTNPNNMNPNQYFQGELDDLQLYAGILSSSQVAALYASPGSTATGSSSASGGHTLIAHYTFDNSGDLGADATGNGNDIYCGSGWGSTGHVFSTNAIAGGGAVEFFGDSSMTPCGQAFTSWTNTLAGSFSVSAWINTTNVVGNDGDNLYDWNGQSVIYADNNNLGATPVALTGAKAAFRTTDPDGHDDTLHSMQSVTTGNYVHIVATRDQTTGEKKIYINGVLDNSDVASTEALTGAQYVSIGGEASSAYSGQVDDVQIYSGVLSASDVAYLYDNPGLSVANVTGTSAEFNVALGTTNLAWATGGDTDWFIETTNTADGISAAQSGSVTSQQSSTISTTVTGPGELTFYWSSIADPSGSFDLEFAIDGGDDDDIYHDTSWYQDGPFSIPAGQHTVSWTAYAYGDTNSTEAGFLDEVSYVPDSAPVITLNPFDQTNYPGYPVWLNASAASVPAANWQWYKVGFGAIPGATSSWLIPTNSGAAGAAGQYYAIAGNVVSSAITTTAAVSFVSAPYPADWSRAFKSPFEAQDPEAFTKDYYYGAVVDASSNIYTAAEFGGNMSVGSQNFDSGSGGDAAAVVKQTPAGSPLWAAAITNNGSGNSYALSVALATNGGVYLSGNYTGNNWLGTNELMGNGVFLASFDTNGNTAWLKTFGGPGGAFTVINCLVSDASGNVTMAALFGSGAVTVGSSNYNVVGQQDIIIQLDPTGAVRWSQLVPSSFVQYLAYSAGRLYVSATTATTGGTTSIVIGGTSNLTDRAWAVACLDANTGNAIWVGGVGAASGGGGGNPYYTGVIDDVPRLAVSGTNLFLTGVAYGPSASFGPITVNFPLPRGEYFARYDTNGNPQVATTYGSVTTTPLAAVANSAGDVYVDGDYDETSFFGNDMIAGPAYPPVFAGDFNQAFLAKFDSNGNPLWAREALASLDASVRGIALAPDGVWASGWCLSSNFAPVEYIEFGTNYIYSDGQYLVGGEGSGVNIIWNPGGF
ncbi:MAG: LamG-like jellyroll fold domain-containing protein, partial [Limisphaerales bacterium]